MSVPGVFYALLVTGATVAAAQHSLHAETLPARGAIDSRIRVAPYHAEEVYRLHGYVGYQIALEFEARERFVGLGAGDLEGIAYAAEDNYLFLKPKAAQLATNVTVLTTRRHYHLDYSASADKPDFATADVIYALRFTYPPPPTEPAHALATANKPRPTPDTLLATTTSARSTNRRYQYKGHRALEPESVSDDGVHTRIKLRLRGEFPAIFVKNEDGAESLLNFSVEGGDVIVHRVARELILRRGRLTGRIVNHAYQGAGERLDTGTVSPDVRRDRAPARAHDPG